MSQLITVWVLVHYRKFLWFRLYDGVAPSAYDNFNDAASELKNLQRVGYLVEMQPVRLLLLEEDNKRARW